MDIVEQESIIFVENSNISEFLSLPVFETGISAVGSDRSTGKSSLEINNNFVIDSSRIKKLITEEYTSYTAVIRRDFSGNEYFENIVVMKWKNKSEAKAYLIMYTPNSKVEVFEEHSSFSFKGNRSIRLLSNEGNIFNKTSGECSEHYEWWCNHMYDHIAGEECFKATDGRVFLKLIPDNCSEPEFPDDIGGQSPNPNPGSPDPGGGGDGLGSGDDESLITMPLYPDNSSNTISLLKFILEITDLRQIDYINSNPQFAEKLFNFITDEGSTPAVQAFAKETLYSLVFNPNFEIDLNRSFASPYKVDLSEVQPSQYNPEPEKVKFMHIYDKLLETSFFKEVITDVFDNDDSKMNVTFKIIDGLVVDDEDAAGSTQYSYITGEDALVDNLITINIDKDYLLTQPLIRIAKTLVHEAVHTHLALVNISSPYATKVGNYSPEEFATLLDAHFEVDEDEHEFIAQHYIPTISSAVEEILPLLESQVRIEYIGSLNLFYGSDDLGAWDWEDFYKYISWGGLESTKLFKSKIFQNLILKKYYDWYKSRSSVPEKGTSNNQFSI